MRRWALLWIASLLIGVSSCEAVTGFDDLQFVAEKCVPDDVATVCANVACGTAMDNCGTEVTCADLCMVPFVCGVGGVPSNECGCTGGPSHTTPTAPPRCTAMATFEGHTYYFCGEQNHADARASCQAFGTDLVVISSQGENTFVTSNMLGKSWTGLLAEPPCDPNFGCPFRWVDGTVLDSESYASWNDAEPNNSGGGEFCVEIGNELATPGRWNDVPCANVLSFVCETTCPDV